MIRMGAWADSTSLRFAERPMRHVPALSAQWGASAGAETKRAWLSATRLAQLRERCRTRLPIARIGTVLLVAWLAGCQTMPAMREPTAPIPWDARRAELQQRDRFELRGRVAVAAAGQGFNARLRWEQAGTKAQLALDGPLGVGGVQVVSDGATLTVANSKGERLDSEAARSELTNRLGFEPPIDSLRYWVLGVPDPSQPAEETLDSDQRLVSLQQNGWQIDYTKYVAVGNRWYPQKMTLKRGDVRVRLVVDNWDA